MLQLGGHFTIKPALPVTTAGTEHVLRTLQDSFEDKRSQWSNALGFESIRLHSHWEIMLRLRLPKAAGLQCHKRGVDKSLARPGRKQATATKLQLLQATQKKKKSEDFPSNQVSAAAMTSASDEKWRPFNCFLSRVGLSTYQHPRTIILCCTDMLPLRCSFHQMLVKCSMQY